MEQPPEHPRPVRTLRQHVWRGACAVHRRRPASFYMLLSIPVVLILAVSFFETRDDPYRLAFGLSVLFVFLGVVLIRAFLDISALTRQHLAERRQNFKETIGDESFLEGLRGSGEDDGGAADSGEG